MSKRQINGGFYVRANWLSYCWWFLADTRDYQSTHSTLWKKANRGIMLNFTFKLLSPEDDQRKWKIGRLDSWSTEPKTDHKYEDGGVQSLCRMYLIPNRETRTPTNWILLRVSFSHVAARLMMKTHVWHVKMPVSECFYLDLIFFLFS